MIFFQNPFCNEFFKFQFGSNATSALLSQKLANAENYSVSVRLVALSNESCIFRDQTAGLEMQFFCNTKLVHLCETIYRLYQIEDCLGRTTVFSRYEWINHFVFHEAISNQHSVDFAHDMS